MKGRAILLVVACGLAGCGSAHPRLEGPAPELLPPEPAVTPPSARAPAGKLYQQDVVELVDAGFPQFLQRVEVEAHVRDGKFVGWTVLALYPPDFWSSVDLRAGDVVTAVNGKPIERETQAYDAFQSLKSAPRLVVTYLRAGRPLELSFDIIQRPTLATGIAAR